MTSEKFALVITTINHPTGAVEEVVAHMPGAEIVVVGDNKTPKDWSLDGVRFLSIDEQRESGYDLAAQLAENHYCRKNLGYLAAMSAGAGRIAETDDDNSPAGWDPQNAARVVDAELCTAEGWVNIYRYFTGERIWPRGLPLDRIDLNADTSPGSIGSYDAPVQQYLAAGDPDVDAVYRLVIGKVDHEYRHRSVVLDQGSIVPFNSQSTLWFDSAFMYMYLPSHVSFRMTDIWRSFIAQVCIWSDGGRLAYHAPGVRQDRNEHNLMTDFEQEIVGYRRNDEIMTELLALDLQGTSGDKLKQCYARLAEIDVVPQQELALVDAWVRDVERLTGVRE